MQLHNINLKCNPLAHTQNHARTLATAALIFSVFPREARILCALSQSLAFEAVFKDSLPALPSQIQTKPLCLPGHLLDIPPLSLATPDSAQHVHSELRELPLVCSHRQVKGAQGVSANHFITEH